MRRADWHARLLEAIAEANTCHFSYGGHDCCLFAAKVVDAMCDTTFEAQLRECYTDETSAQAFIAEHGGLQAAVERFLGAPIRPKLAQRGDVVLFTVDGRDTLGIYVGTWIAAAGPRGVVYVPMKYARLAWPTGRQPWERPV